MKYVESGCCRLFLVGLYDFQSGGDHVYLSSLGKSDSSLLSDNGFGQKIWNKLRYILSLVFK